MFVSKCSFIFLERFLEQPWQLASFNMNLKETSKKISFSHIPNKVSNWVFEKMCSFKFDALLSPRLESKHSINSSD